MEYLTREELLGRNRNDAHEILENCAGKSIRDNFASKVFDSAVKSNFGDKARIASVLDLGTARGAFVEKISAAGYLSVYGTDVDDYVRPDNKKLLKEFRTVDLSWDKIPWPDDHFDVVVAWCVLPHLENPFHCVREVRRVLKPGGIFIFTAPYLASKPSADYFVERKDFGSYRANNNHLVLFPSGVVKKSILKYFDLIDIEYHFRPKVFLGWKGPIRKWLYRLAKLMGRVWIKKLAERWAYNIVYVLRNKK